MLNYLQNNMAAEVIIFEDAKMKVTRAGFQSKTLEGRMVGFFMPLTVRSGEADALRFRLRSSGVRVGLHYGIVV